MLSAARNREVFPMPFYPHEVTFPDHIPDDDANAACSAPHFKRWLRNLTAEFDVKGVRVRDVVMFGRRAGFILAEADVRDSEGKKLPGVAFLRGDSVAVLPILRYEGAEPLAVLVRQGRVPIAKAEWHEVPAGMLDEGEFVSKALEEMAEEVGADLKIEEEHLQLVGDLHSTPGGSDELIRVYVAELDVTPETAAALSGRRTGNEHENESITVVAVPLSEALALAGNDMKTRLAIEWFQAETLRRQAEPGDGYEAAFSRAP
jgi:ADP-sugar diphosphatase